MRVRETNIVPITNLSTSSEISQYVNNKVEKNKMWRHIDSADLFVFSRAVNFSLVHDIVVGRVLVDNCLMRMMDLSGGELVDVTLAVNGIHQGYMGFKSRYKKKNATWSDISWNQRVTGFKYINHQGSLQAATRFTPIGLPGVFIQRKPRSNKRAKSV